MKHRMMLVASLISATSGTLSRIQAQAPPSNATQSTFINGSDTFGDEKARGPFLLRSTAF
jgi:hypothetical protein